MLKNKNRESNPPGASTAKWGQDAGPVFRFLAVTKSWYLASGGLGQVLLTLTDFGPSVTQRGHISMVMDLSLVLKISLSYYLEWNH